MAETKPIGVSVPHWSELLRGPKDDMDRVTREYLDLHARELAPELVREIDRALRARGV